MPETPITWQALGAVLVAVGIICGGLWTVYGAIKKQFDRAATLGEERTTRTHALIENLRAHIGATYVPLAVHASELRRLDDALEERDRQINDLAERMPCPAAVKRRRSPTKRSPQT